MIFYNNIYYSRTMVGETGFGSVGVIGKPLTIYPRKRDGTDFHYL